jgi:ATP-dependent DNA ligase
LSPEQPPDLGGTDNYGVALVSMPRTTLAPISPMEARTADQLPLGPGWLYEPKWDGFRCLASKHGRRIALHAKSGKPLDRYFPEILQALAGLKADRFTLDGELLVVEGRGWSFEALQARLHPAASRVLKLSFETPATLMLFDMLEAGGADLRALPLRARRKHLETLVRASDGAVLLSRGTSVRRTAVGWVEGGRYEGVVAKHMDGPYLSGERAMIKVKRRRTADCVVGGFRYATGSRKVGSLLLGLYNAAGKLDHVGFTSGFADIDQAELTRKLERLRGGEGFSGDAPGGPSRWSTERSASWTPLRPKLVVEVSFDHVSGGRFRHGTRLLRLRDDKAPRQCGMEQIA